MTALWSESLGREELSGKVKWKKVKSKRRKGTCGAALPPFLLFTFFLL
jgi:hypothetical protein